jgi:hypothetical protein
MKNPILKSGMMVVFREINREHPEREMPVRRGKVKYLHRGSDQIGVTYEEGITKVWVCEEDIEVEAIV